MTARELIRALTKCDDIDTIITIKGNSVIAFDTERYELIIREDAVTTTDLDFLEELRKIKGNRSVRRWAEDTGVTASYLSALLRGKYVPSIKILSKLTCGKSHPQSNIELYELAATIRQIEKYA